jgi:ferredoxin
MADLEERLDGQAPGRYYVDSNCIDCDVCRETAPENFRANEEEGYSYVHKQPENDEEEAQCRDAMDSCPVEAIGDDGEDA